MIGSKKTTPSLFNFSSEQEFIAHFFPKIKNEDWKYTNLKKHIPRSVTLQPPSPHITTDFLNNLIKRAKTSFVEKNTIFFLDGTLQESLSNIPGGLTIKPFSVKENVSNSIYINSTGSNFIKKNERPYLGFDKIIQSNPLIELNAALSQWPYVFRFEKKFNCKNKIKIVYGYSNPAPFFNQSRNLFFLDSKSRVTIEEVVFNFGSPKSVFNIVSEIICQPHSSLSFYAIQNDKTSSSFINNFFFNTKKEQQCRF